MLGTILRATERAAPYAMFALAVAAFLAFSVSSSPYQKCATNYGQQAADSETRPPPPRVELSYADYAKLFVRCEGIFIHENHGPLTAFATFVIAWFTATLWATGARQLRHARQVDRAYFEGGGECVRSAHGPVLDRNNNRQFRFEVGNHGKTPARMYAYEIDFCTQIEATGKPRPKIALRDHHDQFPPGQTSRPTGPLIAITRPGDDVVFGAVFYRDIWGDKHFSRFILRIDLATGQTFSDMRNVDSYRGSN